MKAEEVFWKALQLTLAIAAGVALALVCCTGCITPGSQPAKSQTMTVRDCTITFNVTGGGETNGVPFSLGDLIAQNQSLESTGTETYSPTATPTQTISPQTTATLSRAGASTDALTSLLKAGVQSLTSGSASSASSDSDSSSSTAGTASDCSDGSCSPE